MAGASRFDPFTLSPASAVIARFQPANRSTTRCVSCPAPRNGVLSHRLRPVSTSEPRQFTPSYPNAFATGKVTPSVDGRNWRQRSRASLTRLFRSRNRGETQARWRFLPPNNSGGRPRCSPDQRCRAPLTQSAARISRSQQQIYATRHGYFFARQPVPKLQVLPK